jgi:hypothetical protein
MTESWINTNTQQSTHEEKRITRGEDGNCQERAKRKDAVLLDTISSTGKPMAWLFYRHPKTCSNPLVLRTPQNPLTCASEQTSLIVLLPHLFSFWPWSLSLPSFFFDYWPLLRLCWLMMCIRSHFAWIAMTLFKDQLHFVRDRKSARCFREYLYEGFI